MYYNLIYIITITIIYIIITKIYLFLLRAVIKYCLAIIYFSISAFNRNFKKSDSCIYLLSIIKNIIYFKKYTAAFRLLSINVIFCSYDRKDLQHKHSFKPFTLTFVIDFVCTRTENLNRTVKK